MVSEIRLGDMLATSRILYVHYGVVTGFTLTGEPLVTSSSGAAGKVVEESQRNFASGFSVQVHARPLQFNVPQIVERAKGQIGRPYSLFNWNCEHFVRHAYGVEPRSPQLLFSFFLIGAVALASR